MKDLNVWLLLMAVFWLLKKYADVLVNHAYAHSEDAEVQAKSLFLEEKSTYSPR